MFTYKNIFNLECNTVSSVAFTPIVSGDREEKHLFNMWGGVHVCTSTYTYNRLNVDTKVAFTYVRS